MQRVKNLTVAQNIDNATGEHTYTYALSNDVDLTQMVP